MAQLDADLFPAIARTCRNNAAAIAECLQVCLGREFTVSVDDTPEAWRFNTVPPELDGPGLVVAVGSGESAAVLLIPERLPLPEWWQKPTKSERARLDTLPMELGTAILPVRVIADRFATSAVPNLFKAISAVTEPATQRIAWTIAGSAEPCPAWLFFPTAFPDFPDDAYSSVASPAAAARNEALREARRRQLLNTLLRLSVPVRVRLADKRFPLRQLLALSPGGILAFDKPCEDLLELCVNNRVHCRGEAVKIGERIGLKVNQLGPPPGRVSPLRQLDE